MNKLLLSILLVTTLYADESSFIDEAFAKEIQKKSTYSIVILPLQNATMDGDLSYHFRQRVGLRLRAKGYSIIDFDKVDNALRELGVQSSEQIALVNFKTLTKLTSADAIISGIVETGSKQNALIYSGYAFTGSLKLEDKNAKVLWYNLSQRVAKRRLAIDPINMLINTALDSDESNKSINATYAVADKLLENFPQGPIQIVSDNLLDQAIQIGD